MHATKFNFGDCRMTFVQAAEIQVAGPIAVQAFSGNNVAGNTIIVFAVADHSFVSGPFDPNYNMVITDTQGNVYTQVGTHLYTINSVNRITDSQIWIAANLAAGPNTVTLTASGSPAIGNTYLTIAEYTGHVGVSPLTAFATNVAFSGPLTVNLSTTQSNEMIVLMGVIGNATPPVGFMTRTFIPFPFW